MYYLKIREFDLKLSVKSEKYQGILFHELAGNPVISALGFSELF